MSDLINRQDAIDAINQICPIDTEYDCTLLDRVDVRCVLTDLPSAQPTIDAEPVRRGRWLLEDNPDTGWYRIACSKCGEDVASIAPCLGRVVTWDYCPYCGAKMEG